MGDLRVRQRGLAELARCSRTSRTSRTGRTRGTTDHPASADIKTIGGKCAVTTAVRRDQQLPCLSCRRHDKRLSPASSPESGALSRGYPGVLQERSDGSILKYVTGAANAARRAGVKQPPSGGSNNYLACRAGGATKGFPPPAARNQERYRTAGRVLPRSPRGECT